MKYIRLVGDSNEVFEWTRDIIRISDDIWDQIDAINEATKAGLNRFLDDPGLRTTGETSTQDNEETFQKPC
jgi:hypothetical protein